MAFTKKKQDLIIERPAPAIELKRDWTAVSALVIGLGESGLACARWLARKGARITVVDTRDEPPMLSEFRRLLGTLPTVRLQTGVAAPLAADLLEGMDMVIPSPGLTPHAVHASPIAGLLDTARARDIAVYGEIDLFEWAIHHAAHASSVSEAGTDLELPFELPRVLAITGTNGKTTTTQMTVALLRRAGIDAQEAGNISPSLLDAVIQREDESRFPQVWVLELSSFQLAVARHFHPAAGVLLNVTEDHLDWHRDFEDYLESKLRIFGIGIDHRRAQILRVINRDDEALFRRASALGPCISFGSGRPPQPGDLGLIEEGISWMCVRDVLDEERLHRLMPADALRIRGRHNTMNALAALALCKAVTPALAPLLHGLREFQGGLHRVQWVGRIADVDFIDDSKGTNVGATSAALRGLGQRVVLIAGGEGKGQDFSPLKAPIAEHARAVVAIGRDGEQIARVALDAGVTVVHAASMAEAVQMAFDQASDGEAVLLSPACASFDMFRNYGERGRVFVDEVKALASREGVPC